MQQTTTYKLNLIEADDVFSPEPLSENARKVDAALSSTASALAAETAARKSADTAGTAAWQRAVASEAAARQSAVTAEAAARQKAVADETAARKSAVSAEAAARQKAVSDEAALRQKAIAAETAARQSADAALDRRLKVFEAHRAASGTYTAKDSKLPIKVNLGFTPRLLFIHGLVENHNSAMILPGETSTSRARIVPNGFIIPAGYNYFLNYQNHQYAYIAYA